MLTLYIVTLFTSLQIQNINVLIKYKPKHVLMWKNPLQISIYSNENLTTRMAGNINTKCTIFSYKFLNYRK